MRWVRVWVAISVGTPASVGALQQDRWFSANPLPRLAPQGHVSPTPAWIAPAASLVVPGSGQIMQGHPRAVGYIAVEAWLWGRYATSLGTGKFERNLYIDIAFTRARADFQPTIRDTTFQYFETVGKFVESGPFDTDPGPDFSPPSSPDTYNGFVWTLALETFFPAGTTDPDIDSPEYQRAVAFYRARAVGPNFLWSWEGKPEDLQRYRDAVRDSDSAFKRSSQTLGLLLANHVLAALDAYVSQRLASAGASAAIRTHIWHGEGWARWPTARLAVGFSF